MTIERRRALARPARHGRRFLAQAGYFIAAGTRQRTRRAALCAIVAVHSTLSLAASPAHAADAPDAQAPVPSAAPNRVPRRPTPPQLPADMKVESAHVTAPPTRAFVHSVVADFDAGASHSTARGNALPDDRKTQFFTVAMRFGMGERGTGSLAVTGSSTRVDANDSGGFATHSDVHGSALSAGAGYWLRPDLALGLLASYNDGSGNLAYLPANGNATNTRGTQFGPYLSWRLPFAQALGLSLTSTFLFGHGNQQFTNNFPDHEASDSKMWVNTLAGTHTIDRWTLQGALSWTHVASQHVGDPAFLFGPPPPAPDRDWATLSAGLGYWLTPKWELRLNAAAWLGASQATFHQLGVGLTHAF
jgi:hypothetical protein